MTSLSLLTLNLLVIAVSGSTVDEGDYPLPRFEYEYKVLQTLVKLDQGLADLESSNKRRDRMIDRLQQDLKDAKQNQIKGAAGSVFVRWGRTFCPGNGTELVYRGYAGGSHYTHRGAAANYLCLPEDPTWGDFNDATTSIGAVVYGAEYQFHRRGDATWNSGYAGAHDHDVPCAVCRSRRPTMVMIPGRVDCYDSWSVEYWGYLAAGHHDNAAASEYVCLDRELEFVDGGGVVNDDGVLFYLTEGRCGSLKCPPYVAGRELPCVVCTK